MTADSGAPAVQCRALRKRYGATDAVAGIDLSIQRGEVFGLLGPDGAGKTTTIRMLTAVLEPTSGQASVLGFDVREQPEAVKARMGYLSQRFSLYGDLTVDENIEFFADLYQVPAGERSERSRRLLDAARMLPFRGRLAQNLSGGMKQKLALTCALIHTPEIVFLDEPTTGVDPLSRREFWRILYGLAADGVTLVVSTPYMDEAERCTRIALMHLGRVLTVGSPASVVAGMHGSLLVVGCADLRAARDALRTQPWASSVEPFGAELHVIVDRAGRAPEALKALHTAGIADPDVHERSPELEDAFVEMTRRETDRE